MCACDRHPLQIVYDGDYRWKVHDVYATINNSNGPRIQMTLPPEEECVVDFLEAARTIQMLGPMDPRPYDEKKRTMIKSVNWDKVGKI